MKSARLIPVFSALAFPIVAGLAQTAMPVPAFEVASIKPNNASGNFVEVMPGTLTVHSGTVATCITWAYGVQHSQVSGADPAVSNLLNSERYDIIAKSGGAVPESQLKLMLQTLLAERFKLALHRQNKLLQSYTLVLSKSGPKFHESEGEGESKQQAKSRLIRHWTFTTMAQFAAEISGAMEGPVVDQTGLSAKYDFSIDLTPYLPADPGQRPDMATMVITAIQEQLGLKLESRKAPMEVLVVDHLEKPSANSCRDISGLPALLRDSLHPGLQRQRLWIALGDGSSDNRVVPRKEDHDVRLFIDSDGLLSRLNFETSEVAHGDLANPVDGLESGFDLYQADLSPSLLAHLLDTFGSDSSARNWLLSQCGSLNNRTPLEVIEAEGHEAEVERVLNCIDYGMLA